MTPFPNLVLVKSPSFLLTCPKNIASLNLRVLKFCILQISSRLKSCRSTAIIEPMSRVQTQSFSPSRSRLTEKPSFESDIIDYAPDSSFWSDIYHDPVSTYSFSSSKSLFESELDELLIFPDLTDLAFSDFKLNCFLISSSWVSFSRSLSPQLFDQ